VGRHPADAKEYYIGSLSTQLRCVERVAATVYVECRLNIYTCDVGGHPADAAEYYISLGAELPMQEVRMFFSATFDMKSSNASGMERAERTFTLPCLMILGMEALLTVRRARFSARNIRR